MLIIVSLTVPPSGRILPSMTSRLNKCAWAALKSHCILFYLTSKIQLFVYKSSCAILQVTISSHKTDYFSQRPLYFVVIGGHSIMEVTERLFATGGRHNLLWSKAKLSEVSLVLQQYAVYHRWSGQLPKNRIVEVGVLAAFANKDSWQARPRLTLSYHIIFVFKQMSKKIHF